MRTTIEHPALSRVKNSDSRQQRAVNWLSAALSNGPRTQRFILKTGKAAGYSEVALREALQVIGGSHWHPFAKMSHGGLWCPPEDSETP